MSFAEQIYPNKMGIELSNRMQNIKLDGNITEAEIQEKAAKYFGSDNKINSNDTFQKQPACQAPQIQDSFQKAQTAPLAPAQNAPAVQNPEQPQAQPQTAQYQFSNLQSPAQPVIYQPQAPVYQPYAGPVTYPGAYSPQIVPSQNNGVSQPAGYQTSASALAQYQIPQGQYALQNPYAAYGQQVLPPQYPQGAVNSVV